MIVVAIIGILAAIAIPNFLKFQSRTRQSEAKTQLKGFATSAKSYASSNPTGFTYACGRCDWAPEGTNLYSYTVSDNADDNVTGSKNCDAAGNDTVAQSESGFTAIAHGNIDGDATCDTWQINDVLSLTNPTNDVDS